MLRVRSMAAMAAAALALTGAGVAAAQLLPPLGGIVNEVGRVGDEVLGRATDQAGRLGSTARQLADARRARLRSLVRAYPEALEMTDSGPAVRGEIIAVDPAPAALDAARAAGFVIVAQERIAGLDIAAVTLRPPRGMGLRKALARLRKLAPEASVSANHLHIQSGGRAITGLAAGPVGLVGRGSGAPAIGLIDGGVAAHPALPGSAEQRGFVRGAPAASAHGTAVASLAVGSGRIRGAAPRAHLLVADIFGRDPAGGNAVALAKALGWMAQRRVPVVTVSLVGPANPLVAKAIAQAQARGVHIVAAVGNDGPAAPPAYPASYPGVIAVSGVDALNRALPEAGRAEHLDYAAPGADMAAAAPGGRLAGVRGTSYAAPLVAGRIALALARGAAPRRALDAEAEDLGPRGPDRHFGRGLVCGACRTPPPKN